MGLSIPVVWSDAHRRHAPETGVRLGVAIDADRPIRTTVVVQEGGYVLDTVGALVLAALEGLDEAR